MRLPALLLASAAIAAPAIASAAPSHEWKLDRPVVSRFWPAKGDPGTKVTIHGQNFTTDSVVVWGGATVPGAHVTPTEISFTVPHDAKTGELEVREGPRDLPVGTYDVEHYDAARDQAKLDADRRQQAELVWKTRQSTLAKDAAARGADLAKREHDLEATRDKRREVEMSELRTKWRAPALANPDVQAELTLHGQRVAELDRMDRLATAKADGKIAVRIQVALAKENDRHEQRMSTLQNMSKK